MSDPNLLPEPSACITSPYAMNAPPISNPLPEDMFEVAKLWQDVFHDSDDYVELFFNRVYKPENTLVIKRDDHIISALQMIPYTVKLHERIVRAAYLCGLCTLPSEQGRGYMKKLIHDAMRQLQKRGDGLAFVIPAEPSLFNFYRKLGFTSPVNQTTETRFFDDYIINVWDRNCPYTFETCTSEYFTYFDRKQQELDKTILHDASDFETILQELKIDEGQAFVALDHQTPVGMALAKKCSPNTVLLKTLFADSLIINTVLQIHACRLFDAKYVKIILPEAPEKESTPYGLACIIDNQYYNLNNLFLSLMLD